MFIYVLNLELYGIHRGSIAITSRDVFQLLKIGASNNVIGVHLIRSQIQFSLEGQSLNVHVVDRKHCCIRTYRRECSARKNNGSIFWYSKLTALTVHIARRRRAVIVKNLEGDRPIAGSVGEHAPHHIEYSQVEELTIFLILVIVNPNLYFICCSKLRFPLVNTGSIYRIPTAYRNMGCRRIYILKVCIIGSCICSGITNQEAIIKLHVCLGSLVKFNAQRRSRIRACTSNSFKRIVFRNFLVRGQV